jgi:ParB family chromosome partitioning protein
MEKEIFDIYVDDIIPNRFQPRLTFDEKSLNELADSIKQHGIIQPLVVRKVGDKYEIIAGERRYKASQLAGLQKVPAVIMNLNDQESAEVAVVENIQRRDLSALEEAESYKKLLDKGYLTQEQLATRMGKTQATVSNKLRLLALDNDVKDALLNEKISERHARSLLSLKDSAKQKEVLSKIIDNKLTVRQTDDLIKSMISGDTIETLDFNNAPVENTINEVNKEPAVNAKKEEEITSTTSDNSKNIIDINDFITKTPNPFMDIPNVVIQNPNTSVSQTVEKTDDEQTKSGEETNKNQLKFEAIPTIDINKIKEEAEDINQGAPTANIDSLLGKMLKEETPKEEVKEASSEPKFRFINPFDAETDEEEKNKNSGVSSPNSFFDPIPINFQENNNISEPKTYTDSLVQEYRQANNVEPEQKKIIPGDLRSAISTITELTNELEKNNFKISVEEFDFEHLYQMIIKIEK